MNIVTDSQGTHHSTGLKEYLTRNAPSTSCGPQTCLLTHFPISDGHNRWFPCYPTRINADFEPIFGAEVRKIQLFNYPDTAIRASAYLNCGVARFTKFPNSCISLQKIPSILLSPLVPAATLQNWQSEKSIVTEYHSGRGSESSQILIIPAY